MSTPTYTIKSQAKAAYEKFIEKGAGAFAPIPWDEHGSHFKEIWCDIAQAVVDDYFENAQPASLKRPMDDYFENATPQLMLIIGEEVEGHSDMAAAAIQIQFGMTEVEWFKLPLKLRQKWWGETSCGQFDPSPVLRSEIDKALGR